MHWTQVSLTQNGFWVEHAVVTLLVHCTHLPASQAGKFGSFAAHDASDVQGTQVWVGSQIGFAGSLQSALVLHWMQVSFRQIGLAGTSVGQSLLVLVHCTQTPPGTAVSQTGFFGSVQSAFFEHVPVHWFPTHNGALAGQSVAWVATVHWTQV